MSRPTIHIVNHATIPLGFELPALVAAANIYVASLHSHWGVSCRLSLAPPKPGSWTMAFMNDADAAGALGYHDITASGAPLGKVFVKTSLDNGEIPSVTFAHELAEICCDPFTEKLAMNLDTGDIFPLEAADPVEESTFTINGIHFSNFVLPSWFHSWNVNNPPYDLLGKLTAPFQLDAGGYASVLRNGQFTNIFGSQAKAERFAKEDRRQHRMTHWAERMQRIHCTSRPGVLL